MLLGKGEMTADMSTWRLVLKRSQSTLPESNVLQKNISEVDFVHVSLLSILGI